MKGYIYSVEIQNNPLGGGAREQIRAVTPEAAAQEAARLCGETLESWRPHQTREHQGTGRTATRRIMVFPTRLSFGVDGKPRY